MDDLRNVPTQTRSRRTLDAIMAAADRLFLERGVDRTTTASIARHAGVSIGALYRFFPNKDALVVEYVNRYLTELARHTMLPLPTPLSLDDVDQLVSDLVNRSAAVRREFPGYSAVRNWRSVETNERPAQIVSDAEEALISSLLAASVYDLSELEIDRITQVIVLFTYPAHERLSVVSESEADWLLDELKCVLCSYIRARLENTPRR